jgi:hypothetical protein
MARSTLPAPSTTGPMMAPLSTRRDVVVADDFLQCRQCCPCGTTLWMPELLAPGLADYREFLMEGLAGTYLPCSACGRRFHPHSGRFERREADLPDLRTHRPTRGHKSANPLRIHNTAE